MRIILVLALVVFGLALGSFVNALVWRLHEQERLNEKKRKPSKKQLDKLSIVHGRSMCTYCHHQLVTQDLIPVFSWIWLRGKCRYCHKKIDDSPVVETFTALLFIISYDFWPASFHGIGLIDFICWLIFLVGFVALAVYDLKWYLLPNRIVYPLLVLAGVQTIISILFYHGGLGVAGSAFWGVIVGGGLFYVLFQVSKGKWIGGGDVKLGALLGLIIGGPLATCLLLFMASLSGTLISLPLMASGKVKRTTVVPFGPFLLFAAVIVRLFGVSLIHWLQQRAFLPQT